MTTRYAATEDELATWIEAAGAPTYRLAQVVDALYRQRIPLEAASPLPQSLRAEIANAFPLALDPIVESSGDDGQTVKWLWRCRHDRAQIETVLMRYPTRATVCVSSQAGCAMGCTFCATGQAGFVRHLDAGEIVEQVLRAAHASPQPVNNVVFMGMGEPLANYDATWAAVERLHRDVGLSARHITISTVGIVPGIRRLATETLPVTLAISLHAPDDELRNTMIPVNRRYPLAEVIDAAAELGASRGRRVTFEYACIAGVNDLLEHAHALVRLLRPLGPRGSHVNLIPLNDTAGYQGAAPVPVRMQAFATILRSGGLTATVRKNRGTDIDAACGQLRSRVEAEAATVPEVAVHIGGGRVDKNGAVNDYRWINPSQPQTLYGATILCYIDAVFGILSFSPLVILIAIGLGAGGFGIANEKKWGYSVALAAAVIQVALLILIFGIDVFGFPQILSLMFDGLLVGLLVHPLSRDYQRIWFR